MLYDIIVTPLIYLIEVVFCAFWLLTSSPGIAIVGVSIAVNLLCLPLYKMADDQQERERAKQKSMQKWVDHINQTFSGDERYMMLSAYYAEQGYRPIQALVGSLSLLLQIPFFMAAYSYLSNLDMLKGASFLFMENLGAPDAMLTIGSFTINVLPIVMTLLNCGSTYIYTKGLALRDKAQAYLLALVFLVLLYDSPSGLVFYWTCNQVFSLLKNVFMKVLRNPRKWALALVEFCAVIGFGWLLTTHKLSSAKQWLFVAAFFALFEVAWFWVAFKRDKTRKLLGDKGTPAKRDVLVEFTLAVLLMSCLMGILIPSAVVADSPSEFISIVERVNPLFSIRHSACVWLGTLVLWVGTYFILSGEQARKWFAVSAWALAGVCLVDYFLFGKGLGNISPRLVFDEVPHYAAREQAINLAVLAVVVLVLVVVWVRANRVVTPVLAILTLSTLVLAAPNLLTIRGALVQARADAKVQQEHALVDGEGNVREIFHLSKTERNVVVVFLDRAISGYLPYIMNERPELVSQFDGFTYYPNTISFGGVTNYGAPALFGGYEYTPTAMDARDTELLADKHDEALLVMPTLLSEAGFQTTIVDPPYAGSYRWTPDLSIYDSLKNTEAVAVQHAYTPLLRTQYGLKHESSASERTFFWYGAFKVLPECLQGVLYNNGWYLSTQTEIEPWDSTLNEYATLEYLTEMTDAESDSGGFVLLTNNITHDPDYLQLPDYVPSPAVHNEGLEDFSRFEVDGRRAVMNTDELQLKHYHVNAAALIKLGEWFAWMQEEGVYDNTRIIIVADHGRSLHSFEDWPIKGDLDVMLVNPLLLVKDFDAHGFETSYEFMTNADVPAMALAGIIENPVNPFTGVSITTDEKYAHDQLITNSSNWETSENNGYVFDSSDGHWYAVHDDIFVEDNWQRLD